MEFDGDNAIELLFWVGMLSRIPSSLHEHHRIFVSERPEVLGAQPTLKADLNPAGDICGVNVAKCVEWMHSKCEADVAV